VEGQVGDEAVGLHESMESAPAYWTMPIRTFFLEICRRVDVDVEGGRGVREEFYRQEQPTLNVKKRSYLKHFTKIM
jgi:hypothetical protein